MNVLAWSLKNTHKFHFVSKVAGRMFIRIIFFIDTILPTSQRRINLVSTLWITIQITVIRCWKWNNKIQSRIFNVSQHRYNVGVQHWNNVKSALHNVNGTVFQRCTMFQRCFNVDMTLSQRCFNLAFTSVKAISKPIWQMKKYGFSERLISFILLNGKIFFTIY